jgi:multidrug efflux pump
LIALTLSPMMCSRVLRSERTGGRFARIIDSGFDRLRARYQHRLERTLDSRPVTLLVLAGIIAITSLMYLTTQRELAPEEDQSVLLLNVKSPQYANLDYLEHATADLYNRLESVPEKSYFFAINGFQGVHQAFAGLLLEPWDQRARSAKQVLQSLQPIFDSVASAQVFAFSPPPLPGSGFGTPVQFVVTTTHGYRELEQAVAALRQAAMKSGMFIFTDVDLQIGTPQIDLAVDSDKANQLGLTQQDIGTALATLLSGNYVNRFNLEGRSYQVIPQVPRDYRLSSEWLTRYRVRSSSGTLVPLASVVSIDRSTQPNALTSFQQLNAATLSGVPFPGRTIGDALEVLQREAKEILPAGFSFDYQGQSRQYV